MDDEQEEKHITKTIGFKKQFERLVALTTECLRRLNIVMDLESLSDDIIISIIYTSLAPIFIPVESGKEFELGGLQDAASQCLVCVFAGKSDQRGFILDQVVEGVSGMGNKSGKKGKYM
jgi:hypothetical protein